jgi:hypothetical protein
LGVSGCGGNGAIRKRFLVREKTLMDYVSARGSYLICIPMLAGFGNQQLPFHC